MDDTMRFPEGMPPAQREALAQVITQLAVQVSNYGPDIQQYVFPGAPLPGHVWRDAREVFWEAVGDFAPGLNGAEVPLLFVGAHSQNRVTGSREALGFLLTDQTVLVLKEPKGLFARDVLTFPLVDRSTAETAASTLEWKWLDGLFQQQGADPSVMRARLTQVLGDAVALVVSAMQGAGAAPAVRQTARDVPGRLRELGLADKVKLGTDPKQKKHMTKLANKLSIPGSERIVITISDATLAGPYGVVITNVGVHSRDLMEDPVPPTLRAAINPAFVAIDEEVLSVGPGQVHTLPHSLTDSEKAALLVFLRELFAGELVEG